MIKAYRLRLLGWIFIFEIFLDMITTIIGCGLLGTIELNKLGFTWYLIFELIFSMVFIFCLIKYYDRTELRYQLAKPNIYKIFIILLSIGVLLRLAIIVNNFYQMWMTYYLHTIFHT